MSGVRTHPTAAISIIKIKKKIKKNYMHIYIKQAHRKESFPDIPMLIKGHIKHALRATKNCENCHCSATINN
jgi:hypothetical protein